MNVPDFQPSWWGRPGTEQRCAEVRAAFQQSQLFLAMCELSRALDSQPTGVPGAASLILAITSVSWLSHLADEVDAEVGHERPSPLVGGARRPALDGAAHLRTLNDEILDAALGHEHAKADRSQEVEV